MKVNKTYISIVVVVIVAVVVGGWYLLRPQGTIEFAVAPHTLHITIADTATRTITNQQKVTLSPGSYDIHFSQEGFADASQKVTVVHKQTTRVVMALDPKTDAAKKQLADDESQKIVAEYASIKRAKLIDNLPMSGANYAITACDSVKHPGTTDKALCIATTDTAGETAARKALQQIGYNPADFELLVGSQTIKTILRASSYKVEYYTNTDLEHSNRPALFVTPLTTTSSSYGSSYNPTLETIRDTALGDLTDAGYDIRKYDIYYSNNYLAKYNPGVAAPEEHALPPIKW